jgi:subtilisin family serine protease
MKKLVAWMALFTVVVLNFKFCYAHADSQRSARSVWQAPSCSPTEKKCDTKLAKRRYPKPPYKIAVIDTGYQADLASVPAKLCDSGHYDYGARSAALGCVAPHGVQIASLIAENLRDVDYCLIIYQTAVLNQKKMPELAKTDIANAVNSAIGEGVVAINLSVAIKDQPSMEERQALEFAAEAGIAVFIAAGNIGQDLDKTCDVYPACYKLPHEIVVGAQSRLDPKKPAAYSNYGKVVQVWAQDWYDDGNVVKAGTSYAVPRALSEYILFLDSRNKH